MTKRELIDALNAMMPNAGNVIGFRALMDMDDFKGGPVKMIEYECHIAAAGQALALQVHRLAERINAEGLTF